MKYRTDGSECSINELHPELQKLVRKHLNRDDQILICYECVVKANISLLGRLNNFIGEFFWWGVIIPEPRYYASVITENCLIIADYQFSKYDIDFISKNSNSILLADIQSVSERSSGSFYDIIAHGPGNLTLGCVFEASASSQKFSSLLRNAINKKRRVQITNSSHSPKSLEDRLRELTKLHQDGLIDDAEYQQKRKKLIDLV
jgi:hypothetical protein